MRSVTAFAMKSPRACLLLGLVALLILLIPSASGSAMQSSGYRLDWFVPLTGTGASASSAHFSVDLTVGQSVAGSMASEHYKVELGFWNSAGFSPHSTTGPRYLPILSKP